VCRSHHSCVLWTQEPNETRPTCISYLLSRHESPLPTYIVTIHIPYLLIYDTYPLKGLQDRLPRFHLGNSVVVHSYLSHNMFPLHGALVGARSHNPPPAPTTVYWMDWVPTGNKFFIVFISLRHLLNNQLHSLPT